jgi:hypothetical protein
LEAFRDIVQQANEEARHLIQRDLSDINDRLARLPASVGVIGGTYQVEEVCRRTIDTVTHTVGQVIMRLEASDRSGTVSARVVDALMPMLSALRPDPVDYEHITSRLSQAVKPNIAQLIDLASDKRETAGLIVDRILPLLPSIQAAPAIDTDALTLQLITEVRRAIAPIDAFEIKEQVADLVVERLDSRLSVRDKAFNIDYIVEKVTNSVLQQMKAVDGLVASTANMIAGQQTLIESSHTLVSSHSESADILRGIPAKLDSVLNTVVEVAARSPADVAQSLTTTNESLASVKTLVEHIASDSRSLTSRSDDLENLQKTVIQDLNALPGRLESTLKALLDTHTDFAASAEANRQEIEDLRKSNTDYQVQVAKARGAHGQVRVEKDMLGDKLKEMEVDREQLHSQLKDAQAMSSAKASDLIALEAKNFKLEQALAQALTRLQASDVEQQSSKERIANLETTCRESIAAKDKLKSQVSILIFYMTFTYIRL